MPRCAVSLSTAIQISTRVPDRNRHGYAQRLGASNASSFTIFSRSPGLATLTDPAYHTPRTAGPPVVRFSPPAYSSLVPTAAGASFVWAACAGLGPSSSARSNDPIPNHSISDHPKSESTEREQCAPSRRANMFLVTTDIGRMRCAWSAKRAWLSGPQRRTVLNVAAFRCTWIKLGGRLENLAVSSRQLHQPSNPSNSSYSDVRTELRWRVD